MYITIRRSWKSSDRSFCFLLHHYVHLLGGGVFILQVAFSSGVWSSRWDITASSSYSLPILPRDILILSKVLHIYRTEKKLWTGVFCAMVSSDCCGCFAAFRLYFSVHRPMHATSMCCICFILPPSRSKTMSTFPASALELSTCFR